MSTPRLTLADARARTLAAQGLDARNLTVEQAVRASAGIYGSAPTSHFSLAARVPGYTQEALEQSLVADRSIVRVPAMRTSVYLLPVELAFHGLAKLSERNLAWFEKILQMNRGAYAGIADQVEAIVTDRPGTASDIRAALGADAPESPRFSYLLRRMGNEGRILKTATRGGLRSQRFEYAAVQAWIEVPSVRPSLREALERLTPLWLHAHGPGTIADLAWWAGVTIEIAGSAMAASGAIRVDVRGLAGEQWALEATLDATPGEATRGIHLLPVWDAYLMSRRERSRFVAKELLPFVVDASGNVTNVVVDDGEVIGVWDLHGGTLLVGPLPGLSFDLDAVVDAAGAYAGIAEISDVASVEPERLAGRGQNVFQAPLRGLRGD